MKNKAFLQLLHQRRDEFGRRMTIALLARQVHSSRAHVNQVLLNAPGRGHQTRRKLRLVLTPEETKLLNWGH